MKPLFVVMLFCCLELPLTAQNSEPLSLKECIEMAWQTNPGLQAKQSQVESSQAAFRGSRSSYYPDISAAGAHNQFFYNRYNYREQSAGIVSDWFLGNWLLKSAAAEQAGITAGEADYENRRLMLTERVAGLYIGLLQQEYRQEHLQNRLDLLDNHLKITRALWEAGTRPQLDLLQTEIARSQAQEELLTVQAEYRSRRRELGGLLNLPSAQNITLLPFPESQIYLDSLLLMNADNLTFSGNPAIKMLDWQGRAEQLRSRKIFAALLPHLQFFGGYVADGDPTTERNYSLASVSLQFPLFQWGRSKYQRQEFTANYHTLKMERVDLLRELHIRAGQIMEEQQRLSETRRLQTSRLEITRRAFDIASINYQAGLITNLEYLVTQKALNDNLIQIEETRLSIILSAVHFYVLTGEIDKITALQGE